MMDDFNTWLEAPAPAWLVLVVLWMLVSFSLGLNSEIKKVQKSIDWVWANAIQRWH